MKSNYPVFSNLQHGLKLRKPFKAIILLLMLTAAFNAKATCTVKDTTNAVICPGTSYSGHSSAGIYIDTFITAGGCDSIRTLYLSFRNAAINPTVTASGPTSFCAPGSVSLTASYPATIGDLSDLFNSGTGSDPAMDQYQPFVPQTAGVTTGIEILVAGPQGGTGKLILYIGAGISGQAIDSSGTVSLGNVTSFFDAYNNGTMDYVTFPLHNPVLIPGNTYTFRIQTTSNFGVFLNNDPNSTYYSYDAGISYWGPYLQVEAAFQTNVIPNALTGGQWYNGTTPIPGATNPSATFTTPGSYFYSVVNEGCSSPVTVDNTHVYDTIPYVICTGNSYAGHTASGTYTDTYVTASGCDSIRTVNLTVASPPTTGPTVTASGSTAICPNGSVVLTASYPNAIADLSDLANTGVGTYGTDQYQAFVPKIAGITTGIEMLMESPGSGSGKLTIYAGAGISGAVVDSSGTISLSNVTGLPSQPGYFYLTFPLHNPVLVPGQIYTFRIQTSSPFLVFLNQYLKPDKSNF